MKRRVVVLTTGGTIGHRSRGGVAVMEFDPQALAAEIGLADVELSFREVFRKGSMDIVPADWRVLAEAVLAALAERPRGVVILHGTDTMHYTAAALSFMVRDLGTPVVMTGSMIPGGDPGSDALPNLRDAVAVAANADFAEVCVVFSADAPRSKGLIIRGTRARKLHSHAIDAFGSINSPPIGTVRADGSIERSTLAVRPRAEGRASLAAGLNTEVVLVKLTPAMMPGGLERQLSGAAGAVLEGTGVGHIRADLQPVVAAFGRPVVVTTQAVYGGERLGRYDVDRAILAIPNVIPGRDMSSETALVKLMWALAQGGDPASMMRADIAGEIDLTREAGSAGA